MGFTTETLRKTERRETENESKSDTRDPRPKVLDRHGKKTPNRKRDGESPKQHSNSSEKQCNERIDSVRGSTHRGSHSIEKQHNERIDTGCGKGTSRGSHCSEKQHNDRIDSGKGSTCRGSRSSEKQHNDRIDSGRGRGISRGSHSSEKQHNDRIHIERGRGRSRGSHCSQKQHNERVDSGRGRGTSRGRGSFRGTDRRGIVRNQGYDQLNVDIHTKQMHKERDEQGTFKRQYKPSRGSWGKGGMGHDPRSHGRGRGSILGEPSIHARQYGTGRGFSLGNPTVQTSYNGKGRGYQVGNHPLQTKQSVRGGRHNTANVQSQDWTRLQEMSDINKDPNDILLTITAAKDSTFQSKLAEANMTESCYEILINIISKACDARYSQQSLLRLMSMINTSGFLNSHFIKFTYNVTIVKKTLKVIERLFQLMPTHTLPTVELICTLLQDSLPLYPESERVEVAEMLDKLQKEKEGIVEMIQTGSIPRSEKEAAEMPTEEPPENFRNVSDIPTPEELRGVQEIFLRKNIVDKAYQNVEQYLDIQYRLLRMDFLSPLKEGIMNLVANQKMDRNMDIFLYEDAHVISFSCSGKYVCLTIRFDIRHLKQIKWDKAKRLLYGSMLCFSDDNFKNIWYGVVEDRDPKGLETGQFTVKYLGSSQGFLDANIFDRSYQMVESTSYYEAYRHNLIGLKELNVNQLPMQQYILNQDVIDIDPPKYLKKSTMMNFSCLTAKKGQDLKVLDLESWPSADDLKLDQSQYAALKTAITKEFALIQGPPGTGKTYIGLKVIELLMENEHVWNQSGDDTILVVCFTNHALDQFLEGILNSVYADCENKIRHPNNKYIQQLASNPLIRVGGRSSTENVKLGQCMLKEIRRTSNALPSHLYDDLREVEGQMRELEKQLMDVTHQMDRIMCCVVSLDKINQFILPTHWHSLTQYGIPFDILLTGWLMDMKPKELMHRNQNYQDTAKSDIKGDQEGMKKKEERKAKKGENEDGKTILKETSEKDKTNQKEPDKQTLAVSSQQQTDQTKMNGPDNLVTMEEKSVQQTDQTKMNGPDNLVTMEEKSMQQTDQTQLLMDGADNSEATEEKIMQKLTNQTLNERIIEEDEVVSLEGIKLREKYFQTQALDKEMAENDATNGEWILVVGKMWRSHEKDLASDIHKAKPMGNDEAQSITDMWSLDKGKRIQLYKTWISRQRQQMFWKIMTLKNIYDGLGARVSELRDEKDYRILQGAKIIGMTTTGAAKFRQLIQRVDPKIIIVEEAAEVFESHIITSLTRSCEHLILIGDHQQLRPNPHVYELARKYHLDISLFERMVKSGIQCDRLGIQHRMRPDIAELIVPHIYEELQNHESVLKYDDIRGVSSNMHFIKHGHLELHSEGRSHANLHEVDFLVELTKYFIQQEYRETQITILTMYLGQMFAIKTSLMKSDMNAVNCTTVDNYQGEENDIILLSLVRSNEDGRIGFLKVANRVCVALSRAKKGFYAIGNMVQMTQGSRLWRNIIREQKEKGNVSDAITLVCANHPEVKVEVSCKKDFKQFPDGGCTKPCEYRLNCGHVCAKRCHPDDKEHIRYQCKKPCSRKCSADLHKACVKRCNEECNPCLVPVKKVIESCGHENDMLCYVDPERFLCRWPCEDQLACGHGCTKICCEECDPCLVPVKKVIESCGHENDMLCHNDPETFKCQFPCGKEIKCGHICPALCHKQCGPCKVSVKKVIEECGHENDMQCSQLPLRFNCRLSCERTLQCGHSCQKKCAKICTDTCMVYLEKQLPCGHTTKVNCYKNIDSVVCSVMVHKKLSCGHTKQMKCSEKPEKQACLCKCDRLLPCGHMCDRNCNEQCQKQCQVKVDKELPCGHMINTMCSKRIDKCTITMSPRELPCGHVISLACHQNTPNCHCDMRVQKCLPCGHSIITQCGLPLHKISCNIEVDISLECGHTSRDKCGLQVDWKNGKKKCQDKVTFKCPKEMKHRYNIHCGDIKTAVCSMLCQQTLECGHQCSGRCGEACPPCTNQCQQILACEHRCVEKCGVCRATNHAPCPRPCGRIQLCSHVCRGQCGEPCPPCTVKYENRCFHSVNGHEGTCSQPSGPCQYHCPNQCTHDRCSQRCFEPCDRKPCEQPCPQRLMCGHLCSGFCGEPCPQQCRICHKQYYTDISTILGTRVQGRQRYVLLQPCCDAIDAQFMDRLMEDYSERVELQYPCCPVCSTYITCCPRYENTLKSIENDMNQAKRQSAEVAQILSYDQPKINEMSIRHQQSAENKDRDCRFSQNRALVTVLLTRLANPLIRQQAMIEVAYIRALNMWEDEVKWSKQALALTSKHLNASTKNTWIEVSTFALTEAIKTQKDLMFRILESSSSTLEDSNSTTKMAETKKAHTVALLSRLKRTNKYTVQRRHTFTLRPGLGKGIMSLISAYAGFEEEMLVIAQPLLDCVSNDVEIVHACIKEVSHALHEKYSVTDLEWDGTLERQVHLAFDDPALVAACPTNIKWLRCDKVKGRKCLVFTILAIILCIFVYEIPGEIP